MKYLITKAIIYYSENQQDKDIVKPNITTHNINEYKKLLSGLIKCDRIRLSYEEI